MKAVLLPTVEKKHARDSKQFEKLSVKTQELSLLMDESEKTTGKERAAVTKRIRAISQ